MSINNEVFLTGRRKVWMTFVGIFVLGLFFGGIIYPKLPAQIPFSNWFNKFEVKLGLDLQGGAHLVYEADVSQIPLSDRNDAVEGVRDVIERRVNALGVSEPLVQTNKIGDTYRVIVELAGVTDINEAINQIGETPLLEFKEENPNISTTDVELTEEEQKQLDEYNTDAKKRAEDVLARLKAGEDFEALAREVSEDPGTKDNGGDLGFASKGSFVPEFEAELFDNLQDGQISDELVKTQFGYHIIQRVESRDKTAAFEATTTDGEKINLEGTADKEVHGRHILIRTKTASDIRPPVDPWLSTGLSGKNLENARVVFDQNLGAPQISLKFNEEGKQLFADLTEKNIGKPIAIFLDNEPISIPVVQSVISNGEAVITGNFSIQEAKLLAQRLNAGALPVPIELVSQLQVGPSLGHESVAKSITAGMWGLIFVMIFMILVYRLPGLLADIALILYAIVLFGLFELIPVTLTLAGIAGFILSVGMAVDANVLIFERMKEELNLGKSLKQAIEVGFTRAWSSIRDSNISSLITAAILIWFGSAIIKGFALTLSIGILVSMFSAITVTRTFLRLLATPRFEKMLWLFGVKKSSINNQD